MVQVFKKMTHSHSHNGVMIKHEIVRCQKPGLSSWVGPGSRMGHVQLWPYKKSDQRWVRLIASCESQHLINHWISILYSIGFQVHHQVLSAIYVLMDCAEHEPHCYKNYFASSDPHHDISKQLVDTTFVWSFCHGTFAQLTIPIICFTWQVIVHVSLSNRI